jgi:hypothetical protein
MRKDNPIARRLLLSNSLHLSAGTDSKQEDESLSQSKALDQETLDVSVLHGIRSYDLARYLFGCQLDLKMATVRLVESAAWRGLTFPIDPKVCDVELESAQFFQQGTDFDGNPVIYFRRLCMGPWREDVDASILAILFRLERAVASFSATNPKVQFTFVFLEGKPFLSGDEPRKRGVFKALSLGSGSIRSGGEVSRISRNENDDVASDVSSVTSAGMSRDVIQKPPLWHGTNPRVDPTEVLNQHTNHDMDMRLAKILYRHYPEYISRLLVMDPSDKPQNSIRCLLKEDANLLPRVKFLKRFDRLKDFIGEDELLSFAGGNSLISISHFTAG